MRVLSLLRGIYLAVEHVSIGILDVQQELEDHEVVVGVCRSRTYYLLKTFSRYVYYSYGGVQMRWMVRTTKKHTNANFHKWLNQLWNSEAKGYSPDS